MISSVMLYLEKDKRTLALQAPHNFRFRRQMMAMDDYVTAAAAATNTNNLLHGGATYRETRIHQIEQFVSTISGRIKSVNWVNYLVTPPL